MAQISPNWLGDTAVQSLRPVFAEAEGWFVGGCVRDALIGKAGGDLDLATSLTPKAVTANAQALGLKVIPTGIDHGTVTVLAEGQSFEITTFRTDVETDGRHAIVSFGTDITTDAARRDFTMNALYADFEGLVQDPTGQGLADLDNRHVRFIGDPKQRVAEDYLRILRFFRFTAWYGDPALGVDAAGLAACAAGADGLDGLAKERITHEILRLLAAPDPLLSLGAMSQSGMLTRILPGAGILPLQILLDGWPKATVTFRLAALYPDASQILRLTKAMTKDVSTLTQAATGAMSALELGYRLGEAGQGAVHLRAALFGGTATDLDLAQAARGASARFPIGAKDLMPELSGAKLGQALKRLETAWLGSDLTLTKTELLALV